MLSLEKHKIKVRAPASIANLGPGFDVLALAIEGLYDTVDIEVSRGSGSISIEVEGFEVPKGSDNVVYRVAKSFIDRYSLDNLDIGIKIHKGVPPAYGLGSSGASSAATAFALAKLLQKDLSDSELLRLAAEGEVAVAGAPHYDNVAASLFGGIVIVDLLKNCVYKVKPSAPIYIAVVMPRSVTRIEKKTGVARGLLPRYVDLEIHVKQLSALAKLIYALMVGDVELLGEAISTDLVVEPHRAKLIPYYYELKELAIKSGALGFNISGAGPSVFLIHKLHEEALRIGEKLISYLKNKGVDSDLIVTRVNNKGAEVVG